MIVGETVGIEHSALGHGPGAQPGATLDQERVRQAAQQDAADRSAEGGQAIADINSGRKHPGGAGARDEDGLFPSRIAIEQTSRVSVATSSIIGWRTATIWFDDR